MNKADALKQFVSLRDSLQKEKTLLEARLLELNRALGATGGSVPGQDGRAAQSFKLPVKKRTSRRRIKNAISLREAIARVTARKPLTKPEILSAVQKEGYRFGGKDPMNSLQSFLYSRHSGIKNTGGRFSPAVPAKGK